LSHGMSCFNADWNSTGSLVTARRQEHGLRADNFSGFHLLLSFFNRNHFGKAAKDSGGRRCLGRKCPVCSRRNIAFASDGTRYSALPYCLAAGEVAQAIWTKEGVWNRERICRSPTAKTL